MSWLNVYEAFEGLSENEKFRLFEEALLIKGIKGKLDEVGSITDKATIVRIEKFSCSFDALFNQ